MSEEVKDALYNGRRIGHKVGTMPGTLDTIDIWLYKDMYYVVKCNGRTVGIDGLEIISLEDYMARKGKAKVLVDDTVETECKLIQDVEPSKEIMIRNGYKLKSEKMVDSKIVLVFVKPKLLELKLSIVG